MKLTTDKQQEKFYAKLKNYCEDRNVFSINPFLKRSPELKMLTQKDSFYVDCVIESCQYLCLRNTIFAWNNSRLSDTRAIKYMRENSKSFCDFELHVLKVETITTEQEKRSFIERFLAIDLFFRKLERLCENQKAYSAKELVEQLGGNYEEIMARALITDEWKFILETVHEDCFDHIEMPLLTKAMPYDRANKKLFDQCVEERERWSRIENGEEQPRIPLKITLERMP